MSAEDASHWRPSVNPWLIAASVMLATFMEVLDTSVANVALPHIAGTLSATPEESTWVLTSYLVSNAIILPATGWLSSYLGRKRFLTSCIVLFTLTSAACGMATSLGLLVLARVIQGAGGGALQPIAQAILLESFPPEKRGQAMAVFGLGIVCAPIIGPTLGGWITDTYSWRWIFYINVPVGALAFFMANAFIEDPPYVRDSRAGTIDFIGFGLMAIGLGALQIVLDKGQTEDWFASPLIVWLSVLTAVALIAFFVRELTTDEPIVNLRVLKNRNFAVGTLVMAAMGAVLYGSVALLPLFLQTLMGYSATHSGMALSPRGFGAVISMLIVGRLVGRVDSRYLITFGFGMLAFATFMLGDINLGIAMRNVVWPNIGSGLAMGFIFIPLTVTAMGTLPLREMGNASGIFNLLRNLGGSFGIAIMTTLLARGSQVHRAVLTAHLTPYDPAFRQGLQSMTGTLGSRIDPASALQQAYAALSGMVSKQATMLAYVDDFRLLAGLALVCIPMAFLFKGVRSRAGAVGAH